jgi:CRP/FNR family cyclic AMP-dependent transcriptional regulator
MAGAPIEALEHVPLFAGLNKRELRQVAALFKERRFPAGDVIVKEGTGGSAFYLIDSGTAAVSISSAEQGELTVGDHFGEIALIDEGTRLATITARTDLVCWGITLWEFQPLVQANGQIGWKLLESMARLLREARAG